MDQYTFHISVVLLILNLYLLFRASKALRTIRDSDLGFEEISLLTMIMLLVLDVIYFVYSQLNNPLLLAIYDQVNFGMLFGMKFFSFYVIGMFIVYIERTYKYRSECKRKYKCDIAQLDLMDTK